MTQPYQNMNGDISNYNSGLPPVVFQGGYDRRHGDNVPSSVPDIDDIQGGVSDSASEDAGETAVNALRAPVNPSGIKRANGPL